MDKQTITIYDVAREAGVSMATVSRVVNGNPNVKPSTRKKVSEVIERLNYRPNAVARGLASKKTTTVGVILPSVTNLFFASLARGIDDIAAMYKYNIILANSDESKEKEISVFKTILDNQVDGMIFMAQNVTDSFKDVLAQTNTPVVFAGTTIEGEQYYNVNIDIEDAVKEATSYLLKHSKGNRIALITERPNILISNLRIKGYKQAYEEAGLEFDSDLVMQGNLDYTKAEMIYEQLKQLDVDGAVVYEDALATAIMNEFINHGAKVPEDFQIITSDNSLLTDIARPQLSSINQPLYDIGAVAMRLLTKIMNDEPVDERKVVLPYKLTHRGSTIFEEE